jgi:hypothetical protein
MTRYKFIALILLLLATSTGFPDIPKNAYVNGPLLYDSLMEHFPEDPYLEYMFGLVEQESCVTKTNARCWSGRAALNTKHKNGRRAEAGRGLGQFTVAWRSDGSVRLDTFKALRLRYPKELSEFTLATVEQRVDLQTTALVLLFKENYDALRTRIPDADSRLDFADSAYNGGLRDVKKGIDICKKMDGCDPELWFGNVEDVLPKVRRPGLYRKSSYEINTEHVYNVRNLRAPTYSTFVSSLREKSKKTSKDAVCDPSGDAELGDLKLIEYPPPPGIYNPPNR